MTGAELAIRPLSPDTQADFLAFFDGPAFADNPRWASCYCQCYYEDHRVIDWGARTATQNRALACERTSGAAMQGLLAYADGRVVGWCNAAPRALLHAFDEEPLDDAAQVGTIVCFLIHPAHRGQGIATRLLASACAALAAQGLCVAEAHPRTAAHGAAANYHGTVSMYRAAGFVIHRDDGQGAVVMRRTLHAG